MFKCIEVKPAKKVTPKRIDFCKPKYRRVEVVEIVTACDDDVIVIEC